jgi:hypothetical protein
METGQHSTLKILPLFPAPYHLDLEPDRHQLSPFAAAIFALFFGTIAHLRRFTYVPCHSSQAYLGLSSYILTSESQCVQWHTYVFFIKKVTRHGNSTLCQAASGCFTAHIYAVEELFFSRSHCIVKKTLQKKNPLRLTYLRKPL